MASSYFIDPNYKGEFIMRNMETFCAKATHNMGKFAKRTKDIFINTGNKMVDYLTPKHNYSDLSEEDASIMRKLDRAETIDNICWFSFYLIYCMIIIAYCIKQTKNIDEIVEEAE